MSYEKNTWKTGDIVTSEKLNHMEEGIANGGDSGGGVTILNVTAQPDFSTSPPSTIYVPDKTYDEIKAAYDGGQVIILNMVNTPPVTGVMHFDSGTRVFAMRFWGYQYEYAPDGSFSATKTS